MSLRLLQTVALMRRTSSLIVSSKTWSVYPESKTRNSPAEPWSSFMSQPARTQTREECSIDNYCFAAYNPYRYPRVSRVENPSTLHDLCHSVKASNEQFYRVTDNVQGCWIQVDWTPTQTGSHPRARTSQRFEFARDYRRVPCRTVS